MLDRDRSLFTTAVAFLVVACGTASSGSPESGPLGFGGTAGGAGASGLGGTSGAPALATAAGGATASTSSGGATVGGAGGSTSSGGATVGGAGGASTGGAGQTGPEPYRLSIVIPNVAPGEEGTQCIQTRLPNTAPVSVTKLHDTLSAGSHHFIVSALTAANATEMPLTPCKPFRAALQGGPLAITQRKDDTVVTPPGVGYGLAANQLISLELHYINTSTEAMRVEAQTEIFPAEPGTNPQASTVLLIGTTNISIPPQAKTSTGPRYIAMPSVLDGVNYFAITGHTHSQGTGVKVSSAASATAAPTSLYAPTPYEWDSPVLQQLTPAVQVPSGGGFVLQCDWQNTTSSTLTFGESALNEMCFFWAYYYPKKAVSNLILEGIGPVDPSLIVGLGL
jgi:hypothetical protein